LTTEERVPRQAVGRLAAEVVRAATAAAEAVPGPAAGPPAVGDLYALPASAEHDVEWLLAAQDPARPGIFRAVAADTAPWIGGGDVELPEDEPASPLVARCHHWLWLGPADLEAGHRTGRVGAAATARIEERCRCAEEGELAPSPLERETDADPEYRDRHRELADAVLTVKRERRPTVARPATADAEEGQAGQGQVEEGLGSEGQGAEGQAGDVDGPAFFPAIDRDRAYSEPRPWSRPWGSRWAAAAAAVLIALLGWVGWTLSQQGRQMTELSQQLAEARQPVVAVAEPFTIDVTTRGSDLLVPTAAGGQLHLQLAWANPPLPRYRAVVTAVGGREPLLTFGDFTVPEITAQVTLRWGEGLLAPGLYELRLLDPSRTPPRVVRSAPLRIAGDG